MLDMIHTFKILSQSINWLDELYNIEIFFAFNIVQFVEIHFDFWYNKDSETNTF